MVGHPPLVGGPGRGPSTCRWPRHMATHGHHGWAPRMGTTAPIGPSASTSQPTQTTLGPACKRHPADLCMALMQKSAVRLSQGAMRTNRLRAACAIVHGPHPHLKRVSVAQSPLGVGDRQATDGRALAVEHWWIGDRIEGRRGQVRIQNVG